MFHKWLNVVNFVCYHQPTYILTSGGKTKRNWAAVVSFSPELDANSIGRTLTTSGIFKRKAKSTSHALETEPPLLVTNQSIN